MLYKLSSMQKHLENKFDTVIKMVKVNPVSSFEDVGRTRVPDVVYQVSRSSASWFRSRFF